MGANVLFSRVWHRFQLKGRCQLPKKGPAILVSNHVSAIDPLIIQSFSRRPIRWMMAHEYFHIKGLHWVFKNMGVILVERSGRDMAATRAALRALSENYVLGVFPEGKFETSHEFLPFQAGIGLLATKSGAPVYPAYLDGTQRDRGMLEPFLVRCEGSLSFGDRVQIPESRGRHQAETVTRQIEQAIEKLRENRPPTPQRPTKT
jgi:1-acyl-sn-glycerol-3-phosphate acyltransferase